MVKVKKDQKIFWIAGDSCFVIPRKNELLNRLHKETGFEIKHVPECSTFNELASHLYSRDLFNDGNFIFVYNGNIPEHKLTAERIKSSINGSNGSIFVFITENDLTKKSSFNKTFSDILEYFEPFCKNSSKKSAVNSALKSIKKISDWNGNDDFVLSLLEHCNYDCGIVLNEINKARNYNGNKQDSEITFENSKEVFFVPKNLAIFDFSKKIYFKKTNIFDDIEDVCIANGTISLIQVLLEGYTFMMICKSALDSRVTGYEAIQQVAFLLGKNSDQISWRYETLKSIIQRLSVESFGKIIILLENALRSIILEAKDSMIIVKKLVFDILSSYP